MLLQIADNVLTCQIETNLCSARNEKMSGAMHR